MKKGTKYGKTRKGWDNRYGRGFDILLYLDPEEVTYVQKQANKTRRSPGEVLRAMISYGTADAREALRQTTIERLLLEDQRAVSSGSPVPVIPRTITGMPDVPHGPNTPRVHTCGPDDYDTVIRPPACRIFHPRQSDGIRPSLRIEPGDATSATGLPPDLVARWLASW